MQPGGPEGGQAGDTAHLLARLRDGDRAACEALFGLHRRRLLEVVRLRMPASLRSRIPDHEVCQEAILKALQRLERFEYRGEGSFLAWLAAIAERTLLDMIRRDQRRGPVLDAPHDGTGVPCDTRTPSRAAVRNEDVQLLESGLDALSTADRDLIVDREILGVDLDTLAERLGKSREATRVALHRAKSRLAGWFHRHG